MRERLAIALERPLARSGPLPCASTMTQAHSPARLESFPWDWLGRQRNVFLTRGFVESWLRHLGDGELDAIGLAGEAAPVRALFPITKCRENVLGLQTRLWKCVGWNAAWYPWSFVPCDGDTAREFVARLGSSAADWDAVLFGCDETVLPTLRDAASRRGFAIIGEERQVLPWLRVEGRWEDYWRRRPRRLRKDVARNLARAREIGAVCYRTVSGEEECDRLIERFLELHGERWADRGQRTRYAAPGRRQRFLRAVTDAWFRAGKLFLAYLTIGGDVAAIDIGVGDQGKVYDVWGAMNIRFAEISPGKLLQYHVIRDAFARGFREVDLGPGDDRYKSWWAEERRTSVRAILYRGNPRVWLRYHLIPLAKRTVKAAARPLSRAPWRQA
jgi:GNAT acetyltransferase-like protein